VPAFVTTPAGEYAVNRRRAAVRWRRWGELPDRRDVQAGGDRAQTGTFAGEPKQPDGDEQPALQRSERDAERHRGGLSDISVEPHGGSVAAGDGTTTIATLTPIAGFSAPLFCELQGGGGSDGCNVLAEFGYADSGGDDGGEHLGPHRSTR